MHFTMRGPRLLFGHRVDDGSCPYGDADTDVCSAALSVLVVGTYTKRTYCSGDNYDNCPIFLSKLLRKKG